MAWAKAAKPENPTVAALPCTAWSTSWIGWSCSVVAFSPSNTACARCRICPMRSVVSSVKTWNSFSLSRKAPTTFCGGETGGADASSARGRMTPSRRKASALMRKSFAPQVISRPCSMEWIHARKQRKACCDRGTTYGSRSRSFAMYALQSCSKAHAASPTASKPTMRAAPLRVWNARRTLRISSVCAAASWVTTLAWFTCSACVSSWVASAKNTARISASGFCAGAASAGTVDTGSGR